MKRPPANLVSAAQAGYVDPAKAEAWIMTNGPVWIREAIRNENFPIDAALLLLDAKPNLRRQDIVSVVAEIHDVGRSRINRYGERTSKAKRGEVTADQAEARGIRRGSEATLWLGVRR